MKGKSDLRAMMLLVAFGVVLFVGLMNLNVVFEALEYVVMIVKPLVYGGIAAAVINVLVSALEKGLTKLFKRWSPKEKLISTLSLILAFVVIFAVIAGIIILIIPQFASAVPTIVNSIKANWGTISRFLNNLNIDATRVYDLITSSDMTSLLQKLSSNIGNIFGAVLSAAGSITGGFMTALISLVACIYILAGKKSLGRHAKGVLYAYVDKRYADNISYFFVTLNRTFKKFLSSQCIDSCILGALLCITMLILRLPYAGVISALTVVLALVPYFGAFFSCVLGAFFIVLVSPKSALVFIIAFLVVQQIEGNLIYPKVVGSSVGLPALWTLLAVYVGGELFGVIGMILFIPVVSVIYTLLAANVKSRLARRSKGEKNDEAVV